MIKRIFSRLKNPKIIIAVISGLLLILTNLGVIDVEISAKAMEMTNLILGLGVTIGVFSNPDSHEQIEQHSKITFL